MTLTRVQNIEGTSAPNQSITCIARIVRASDGIYPDVSAFAAGTYSVVDTSTYPITTIIEETDLTPISNYIFSYPQLTESWDQDLIGLNFVLTIPVNVLASANHAYLIVCSLLTVDGSQTIINFRDITSNITTGLTITPNFGFISGGLVNISGLGLNNAISVAFNGIPAKFAFYNQFDQNLRVEYFPVSTPGNIDVVVTFNDNSTSILNFTYLQSTFVLPPPQTNLATTTFMPTSGFAFNGWDGNVWWVSENTPATHSYGDLWNCTPAGLVTEFNLPATAALVSCCAGSDGSMYALQQTPGVVFRLAYPFAPGQGITSINLPIVGEYFPESIIVGPDSNLWVLATGIATNSLLFQITPGINGTVTTFSIPGYYLIDFIVNKNGNFYALARTLPITGLAVYFLEITTSGHILSSTIVPNSINMISLAYGCDGNVWIADNGGTDQVTQGVIRVPPANILNASRFTITCSYVGQVVSGPDGNVWTANANALIFGDSGNDSSFSMITPSGVVTTTIAPGSRTGGFGSPNGVLTGICANTTGGLTIPVNIFRQAGAIGYIIDVKNSSVVNYQIINVVQSDGLILNDNVQIIG